MDKDKIAEELRISFEFFNKDEKEFKPLYVKFCEHINQFRRENDLPIVGLPPFLVSALADTLHQTTEIMEEVKTEETVKAFYFHQQHSAIKKLAVFMGIKIVGE